MVNDTLRSLNNGFLRDFRALVIAALERTKNGAQQLSLAGQIAIVGHAVN